MNQLRHLLLRSIQARLMMFMFVVIILTMDQVLDNIEFHLRDMESVATDIIFNYKINSNRLLAIPTLVIGIVFQRFMITGMTAGAVKG
ncbi:hypothetical protein [Paenibacillus silvisoli]|uniref:hypothetical protein n=1 Tax=Paenibacillus silvisoli TaxID=3110539 RepID=UPI0028062475|nr:hypothetical protein [Paenibacillus silvisoli]